MGNRGVAKCASVVDLLQSCKESRSIFISKKNVTFLPFSFYPSFQTKYIFMKGLLLILPLALLMSFSVTDATITKKERRFAKDHLKETRKELVKTVEGLTAAQLSYRTDSARWSVEDCLKHIAMAEMGLWKTIQDGLSQAPNPEKRAEIKMTDEQLLKGIVDRSTKFQTVEQLEPRNTPFKSAAEALT